MRCPQTIEVGAYVLGALVPAERDAFEMHLADCAICREEVAELAVLPGLLGRIDFETARTIAQEGEDSAALFPIGWAGPTARTESEASSPEASGEPPARPSVVRPQRWAGPTVNADLDTRAADPEDSKVVSLLAAAERKRLREQRRRRLVTAGVGLVAACLALVIGLGLPRWTADPGPEFTAMSAAAQNLPITADLALEPDGGGTRLVMKCQYNGEPGSRRSYKLMVVPKGGGDAEQITDWTAGHGDEFQIDGHSAHKTADIDRVEIWNTENRVLMIYRP
jgi:anti-sigma factor RsiW